MKKISIVGVEGSSKNVLMTVLGNKYKNPDQVGLFLYPKSQETFGYVDLMIQRMRTGKWPGNTVAGQSSILEWGLFRKNGDEPMHVCDFSFLDFSGEVYRLTFGSQRDHDTAIYEDKQIASSIEQLKNHIKNSDTLLVFVNLKDYIDEDLTTRQVRETRRLSSQGIVDYATQELKLSHIALVFTQTDAYRVIISNCGGVQGVYQQYFPHVAHRYPNLPVFAVSAVDGAILDADGLPPPAEGFHSEGLNNLMEWIVSTVPGYETLFETAREARKKAVELPAEANWLRKKYRSQFRDEAGRRETLHSLGKVCEQLDAVLCAAPQVEVDADDISPIKKDLSTFREFEKAIDSVMVQVRQCDERKSRTRILRICDEYLLEEAAHDWLLKPAQYIKLKAFTGGAGRENESHAGSHCQKSLQHPLRHFLGLAGGS